MKYAMILAAGRGERMRPLTDTTPKPLLTVAGKPLIVWHLEKLAAAGFTHVVINHAWLGEKIEKTLGDGTQWGLTIQYSAERSALETAGGIRTALPLLGAPDMPFLVVNGDVWTDWSFTKYDAIVTEIQQKKCLAWILLVPNPEHHPQGDFALPLSATSASDTFILSNGANVENTATFAGIGIYDHRFFSDLPEQTPNKLAPLLRGAIQENTLLASLHCQEWYDIGTPERLEYMNTQFMSSNP